MKTLGDFRKLTADLPDDTFFKPDLSEEEVRKNRQTVVVVS